MAQERQTKEEMEKRREEARGYALKNLRAKNLSNLAISYLAQTDDSGFGNTDNDAVEEFLYFPALNSGTKTYDLKSGKEYDLMRNALLGSRKDKRRYSGQVSEFDIIETATNILQQSLATVKVSDVIELIGSTAPIKDSYKNKYIVDLAQSSNEEDKKVVGTLIGGYITYIATQGVSDALKSRANSVRSGLEELVKPEEPKSK